MNCITPGDHIFTARESRQLTRMFMNDEADPNQRRMTDVIRLKKG